MHIYNIGSKFVVGQKLPHHQRWPSYHIIRDGQATTSSEMANLPHHQRWPSYHIIRDVHATTSSDMAKLPHHQRWSSYHIIRDGKSNILSVSICAIYADFRLCDRIKRTAEGSLCYLKHSRSKLEIHLLQRGDRWSENGDLTLPYII